MWVRNPQEIQVLGRHRHVPSLLSEEAKERHGQAADARYSEPEAVLLLLADETIGDGLR